MGELFPPFQTWFLEIINLLADVSVFVATIFAICSYRKWRSELKGKKQFELAQNFIILAHRFQSGFEESRLFSSSSFRDDSKKLQEQNIGTEMKVNFEQHYLLPEIQFRSHSVDSLNVILSSINEIQWEAEGLLPKSVIEELGRFHGIHRKYRAAITHYYTELKRISNGSSSIFYSLPKEKMDESRRIIFGGEPDSLSEEMTEIIENLKDRLKKYIS